MRSQGRGSGKNQEAAMQHFVLEGEYLVPFEELADMLPAHRAFLQKGYEPATSSAPGRRYRRAADF
jgi:hypothetical protein